MASSGFVIHQLPGFALQSGPGSTDYITQMAILHDTYDPVFGAAGVDLMERAQLFQVFSSWWFSGALVLLLISIVVCTLDRTPRLWRQSTDVRVVQPDGYFDPRLPDRAAMSGVPAEGVRAVLRHHHFRVREATTEDGATYLYGDRHQYTKMATLLTHTGLVLFLVAAAVTSRFGVEDGLVLASGDSVTVQPIGTPNLLVLKNYGFAAPGLQNGQATDFTSDLAVYQNGQLLARKIVRVNDPLTVAGYTFHENGFRPAPVIEIRAADGSLLWNGPVALTDTADNAPYTTMGIPGTPLGLQLELQSDASGVATLVAVPYEVTGTNPDGTLVTQNLFPMALGIGDTARSPDTGLTMTLDRVEGATIIIAEQDPGAYIVWVAFLSLIAGLLITFYLPRRRIWTKVGSDGELWIVGRSDRYVDFEGEFGRVLDDLVRARAPSVDPAAGAAATGPA